MSLRAAQALMADLTNRFAVDPTRMHTAGLSGGARVAMKVALDSSGRIAGVFASSAGFPGEPQSKLSFPVFATAGTEDFNNLEMRQLDRIVSSPHRLAIFEGGHTWLPSELATEAVEWMEMEAMRSGRRPRDESMISSILAKREVQVSAAKTDLQAFQELTALSVEFKGLVDISKFAARAQALSRERAIKDGLAAQQAEEQRELKIDSEIAQLEATLENDSEQRAASLFELNKKLTALANQARASDDSAERRLARRVLSGTLAGSRGIPDPDYQAILARVRPAVQTGGQP